MGDVMGHAHTDGGARARWSRRGLSVLVALASLAPGLVFAAVPGSAASASASEASPMTSPPLTAFVSAVDVNTLVPIDLAGDVIGEAIPMGNTPAGVAITPDGSTAYVTNFYDASVTAVDVATHEIKATIPLGDGDYPETIAITPDGTTAYVPERWNGTVSVIDLTTNTVTGTLDIGGHPYWVATTPDGRSALVTGLTSNSVSVIDVSTNTVTATIPVGHTPKGVAVTPDGHLAYVVNADDNDVSVIDIAERSVVATIPVGTTPFRVTVAPDGQTAYVTNWGDLSVTVIDVATQAGTTTISLPDAQQPSLLAVTPDSGTVYVTDEVGNAVTVIDAGTDTVTRSIAVPHTFGIAITPVPSSTTVSVTPDSPVAPGTPVTVTATVAASTPFDTARMWGSVQFLDGTTPVGDPVTVGVDGTAPLTTTLPIGDHALTAVYTPPSPAAFQTSTATPVEVTVSPQPQTITFTTTPPTEPVVGQRYPVEAVGGGSGNTVAFSIDPASTGTCTLTSDGDHAHVVEFQHPGMCAVGATQAGNSEFAAATATQPIAVTKAATTTQLTLSPTTISATITATAPGAGTTTGTVTFSIDGHPAGTTPLVDRTATLTHPPASATTTAVITAIYSGDSDFLGSSVSTTRHNPTIAATVTPRANRFGWYHGPVTVHFTCTPHSAALTAPCPTTVTLSHNGAGQALTRTITATDGGAATVTISGLDVDHTRPVVRLTGPRNGSTYPGQAPTARCIARDSLSGIASCTLHTTSHITSNGIVTTMTAKATDRAGNTSTSRIRFRTLRIYLQGAPYTHTAFQVTEGRTYQLTALSTTRGAPRYYNAAPGGQPPHPSGPRFHPAGRQNHLYRWTLTIRIDHGLSRYPFWDLGINTGHTLHRVRIQPHR